MNNKLLIGGAAVVAAVGFAGGRATAPEPPAIDHSVKQTGAFTIEIADVISTTIKDLKAQNQLLVYQYTGATTVSVARKRLRGLLEGTQELSVPASVTYHLNLDKLTEQSVKFDPVAKVVSVTMPAITMGDVAFEPENARTINGGLLTMSDEIAEELRKANYAKARKAFVNQAQNAAIKGNAEAQAKANIESYFAVPLRVVGHPDVKVTASFAN